MYNTQIKILVTFYLFKILQFSNFFSIFLLLNISKLWIELKTKKKNFKCMLGILFHVVSS